MDGYRLICKLPRGRVTYWLLNAYQDYSSFFDGFSDDWWNLRFKRRHRPTWGEGHVCKCGFDYGAIERYPEDGLEIHLERAKDEEWDRRWK